MPPEVAKRRGVRLPSAAFQAIPLIFCMISLARPVMSCFLRPIKCLLPKTRKPLSNP
jgi:hypothetical protein